MTDASPAKALTRANRGRGQRILASLVAGAGLDEVGSIEKISRKRVEKILRDELHRRWVALFESLQPADWQRGYVHSENGRTTLAEAAAQYDWHCRHHVAHITRLRKSHGW